MAIDHGRNVAAVFGAKVRELRKRQALSQEVLSEIAGISHKYLSELELGYQVPSLTVAVAVARALGVTVDSLVGGASTGAGRRESRNALKVARFIETLSDRDQVRAFRTLREFFKK